MAEKSGFEAQLRRLHRVCGTSNMTELASFFQLGIPELAAAKRLGRIPDGWLLFLLRSRGVNPDWLLSGCGPKSLGPVPAAGPESYVEGNAPQKRLEGLESLRRFSSRDLAEELLRRIAAS